MFRVIFMLIMTNIAFGNYSEGLSYGQSLLGSLDKVTIDPKEVPHYQGVDNKGLDDSDEIDKQAQIASQGKYSKFIHQQFNRENRITLSDKDELIVGADKLVADPLARVAKEFGGEVQTVTSKKSKMHTCEVSGMPYLISCKYLLNPAPYYGEKECEEQHEKSIETCTKTLEVKPVYDTKICEQQGNSVIKKVVTSLVPKKLHRGGVPISVYDASRHDDLSFGKARFVKKEVFDKIADDVDLQVSKYSRLNQHERYSVGWWGIVEWIYTSSVFLDQAKGVEADIKSGKLPLSFYREGERYKTGTPIVGHFDDMFDLKIHYFPYKFKSGDIWVEDLGFHWSDDKPNISGAICTKKSERCIEGSGKKKFYGWEYARSCWKKEITYECKYRSRNNCAALREKGCSQVSGKCLKYIDGVCVNYENTMDCFKGFSEKWTGCDEFKDRSLCNKVNEECIEGQSTKIIAGRDVERDCWKTKVSHACSYESLNNCEQLRLPKCKQVKQECLKTVNDACVVMGRVYKCVDGVNEEWETNCHDLEKKVLNGICTRVSHKASSPTTKSIDGFDHSSSYTRTSLFKCLYPSKNNCSILKARGCLEKSKKCIKTVSDTCVVWSKTYECPELNIQTSQSVRGDIPKCLDGNCRGADDVNDSNIGDAVTRLAVLQEVGKQSDGSSTTKSIFGGNRHECRYNPIGIRNCCKLKGWGNTVGLTSCSPEEQQLSHLRSKGFCVPTGDYCKTKMPVIGCIDRRFTFCCYKGAMPKVFQVATHDQLSISWNSGKHPNCRGLSVEEIQKVKLSENDVKEIAGSMSTKINMPDVRKMQQSISSQMIMAKQKGGYVKEPPKSGERI